MKRKRIYILVVVLGLAMVWLGFLFTYELRIVQQRHHAIEQLNHNASEDSFDSIDEHTQAAGVSSEAVTEAGTGFPLVLAGLGVVFVLGGVFSARQDQKQH